jgi:hypothetical protein
MLFVDSGPKSPFFQLSVFGLSFGIEAGSFSKKENKLNSSATVKAGK